MAKILIVEDDHQELRVIERELSARGHEILTAEDVDQALACLKQDRIDLLIVDMILSGRSGIELLGAIVNPALRRGLGFKILAISGGGDLDSDHYLRAAEKIGADRTLAMPISHDLLIRTVEKLLAARGRP